MSGDYGNGTNNLLEITRNCTGKITDTASLKTIMIVDDNKVNRMILSNILSAEYAVIEAENGKSALELLNKHNDDISAVMLDLVMPIMDGYAVLEAICKDNRYSNLPILVTTENSDTENEMKALSLGAWDFVSKPYHPQIIHFRLKNAIDRSQLSALKQLKYLAEYDALTGIYNKAKFFDATREMIDTNRNENFVFLRFDVDRFQLINSFFGAAEGDNLLIYIARHLQYDIQNFDKATYGRIESDVFGYCIPYDKDMVIDMVVHAKETLASYNQNYDIVPSIGIYVIDDLSISIEEMYNRATLAAKKCKGNYVEYYDYYNESMSSVLAAEQEITNEMNFALENGQFQIYLQPQYNIHTNLPCGAEALVRWIHPTKGIISPGEFIPVFERNGFITKLDYYVWEEACKCLHRWITRGLEPYHISVNVSRVNIYNPKLVETLLELVNRYHLEPSLLNLELTESAYTDNPTAMKKTMNRLQSYGFTIMMDDFGSGYSSLSLLKDIMIDILKIDMQFLSETDLPGRGENIIASVIRMAKWLNIPVIAEGAETIEQVDFLRSVGCDYVQGYYFAKPMPITDYEQLCINLAFDNQMFKSNKSDNYSYDDLFSLSKGTKLLFSNALQAAVIYEFVDDHIEMIRVNEAYYALLGHDDMLANSPDLLELVDKDYRRILLNAFRTCAATQEVVECEYLRFHANGKHLWIYTKLSYISTVGDKHVLIGELTDITMRKEVDFELQKYRNSILLSSHDTHTVLIVDDAAINRTVLKKILHDKFLFLEAENGAEAIEVLKEHQNQIDLILLDISMPVMDGKEFLQYKKNSPEFDGVPVIMITADDSPTQQISTFSLGANDYLVKPFIPEVVTRRVKNVLESNQRFRDMVKEYNNMSEQVKTDLMTGLFNRISAEEMMTKRLANSNSICAMMMLDIDNFKKINDSYGHDYGDKVICAISDKLRLFFRKDDIVARMGGDEFAVFVDNVNTLEILETKAYKLCISMSDIKIDGSSTDITCSIGIAASSNEVNSFEMLYQNADKALYNAKCKGRNTVSVYGKEDSDNFMISKWINDAESVLEAINDLIYVCDKTTYEVIYANEHVCRFAGMTKEECKGKKCYEILMHQTQPCEFCRLSTMSEDKVYTRLFRVPHTSQIFLMRGKDINRNGTIVHIEVAADVVNVANMNLYWEEGDNHGE
ncbi:MAG: EAL domain-containing protein [Oscillospiraceae bacterium]